MSTNTKNDAANKLTGSKPGDKAQDSKFVATTRESQISSQVWGDDEDYDSEEGDEEFGL